MFDIIPILLIFWDKVITQLICGGKTIGFCEIIHHKSEKVTKIGVRLTKLSPQNNLALAFMECQSFQMYLT